MRLLASAIKRRERAPSRAVAYCRGSSSYLVLRCGEQEAVAIRDDNGLVELAGLRLRYVPAAPAADICNARALKTNPLTGDNRSQLIRFAGDAWVLEIADTTATNAPGGNEEGKKKRKRPEYKRFEILGEDVALTVARKI